MTNGWHSWVRSLLLTLVSGLAAMPARATCEGFENVAVPESTPTSDFIIHDDGTVTHLATGLMWARCPFGQTWDAGACAGERQLKPWAEALKAAADSTLAAHDDWRVPNVKELLSIVEERCWNPTLNSDLFPGNPALIYWTSTPNNNELSDSSSGALGMSDSGTSAEDKNIPIYFRLVRTDPNAAVSVDEAKQPVTNP